MATTLAIPVCTPPGARAPFAAPAPEVLCAECGGLSPDPDFEAPCSACCGSGLDPIGFRLPPTRSHNYRFAQWEPGRAQLTVKTAGEPWHRTAVGVYSVVARPCDWPGRAFLVAKFGTDRLHEVYVGADGVTCSCEGHTYLTSAKHNQRAYEAGGETFPTHGCVHADALAALVAGGWFPVTEEGRYGPAE
ncbi:MAG: hypothetical protein E6Q76_01105 [Rhizobium sp.]|nr:MAG: hypothetical protein E6Q76_01105 [Rhizobium sp.]